MLYISVFQINQHLGTHLRWREIYIFMRAASRPDATAEQGALIWQGSASLR